MIPRKAGSERATTPTNIAEAVLLIHGTGVADTEDTGTAWWQRGSDYATDLDDRLGAGFEVFPDGYVFHWTGANSEQDRMAAGAKLWDKLESFEHRGRPFHVIGHSHGGSVLWSALVHGLRRGKTLAFARRLATVGTPFLVFTPARVDGWKLFPVAAGLVCMYLFRESAWVYVLHFRELAEEQLYVQLLLLPLVWLIVAAVTVGWSFAFRLATGGWGIGSVSGDLAVATAHWPTVLLMTTGAVAGVGLAACLAPTLKGIRIRPVDALRTE